MNCFVMFSGGVEATATLQWVKNHPDYDPVAVHSVFDNPLSSSRQVNANIPKICELLDVPLIIHEHPVYEQNFGESEEYIHSSKHWILAACTLALKYPNVKDFMWGVNSGNRNFGDDMSDFHFLPRAWEFQIVFEFFCRQMNDKGHRQRLWPPLNGWTKKEMWDSINPDVKKWVQSCGRPLSYDGQSPCGECHKCREFRFLTMEKIEI